MRVIPLILTLACADEEAALERYVVEAACDDIIFRSHFLIAAVDEPEAIVAWDTTIYDGDAWTVEPDAVYLYDGDPAVFVLAAADYCPLDGELRLSWLW